MNKPLVILGGLAPRHRERVKRFALTLNAPVYAEPLSGLREDRELPLITAGERMIARGAFDGVIRIGNVPALRFWRDLETNGLPAVHYSELPFAGLSAVNDGHVSPIESLPALTGSRDEAFFEEDRHCAARIAQILDEEPQSELAMFRRLSEELPEHARVYLGNSLPIREWDLTATRAKRFVYEANRGANGIDGQLSTFFGWCAPGAENVAVLGDLTALYDMNAPWIVPQLEPGTRFRIVIVNNGGGRIFSRVASLREVDAALRERIIENAHGLRFGQWVAMWNLGEQVTELVPDAAASARAWERYDALWR